MGVFRLVEKAKIRKHIFCFGSIKPKFSDGSAQLGQAFELQLQAHVLLAVISLRSFT